MPARLSYKEGDCFALPLRTEGVARGVVARLDGKGVVFGYFFGPKVASFAEAVVDDSLRPEKAVLVARFGDLGLQKREWKVIGHIDPWERATWRMPGFLHLDDGGDHGFVRHYDDSLKFVGEEPITLSAVSPQTPRDALLGYGAVEIRLTRLLK
jgi:hypothetical protein